MGLEKREVVMVGDSVATDIKGASEFGIASILVRRGKNDESDVVDGAEPDFVCECVRDVLGVFSISRRPISHPPASTARAQVVEPVP
jgi:ribonucleotide monophosphatase NagD (HAD superfamily)